MPDTETLEHIASLETQITDIAQALADHKKMLDIHSSINGSHEKHIRANELGEAMFFNLFAKVLDEQTKTSFSEALRKEAERVEKNKDHNHFYLDWLKAKADTLANPDGAHIQMN